MRRARFGEGHDPDSLRLEAGDEAVLAAVEGARDAVLDELDRLIPPRPEQDPRGRAAAATAVSQLLSPIPDAIVRMGYGRRAAQRLGVPEDLLWKRGGKDRRTAEVQATPPEPSARLTRLLEEMVLARLVAGAGEVPALERLPSPEVFFDPQCRSLYQAFCDAYGELAEVPDDDAVRHRLEAGGEEVARLAAILHAGQDEEVPTEGLRFGLPEILYMLERRFLERRQKELAAALREAQQNGDLELLESLVEKKQLVSRRLHRGAASA